MLVFIEKLCQTPSAVTAADVAPVLAAGVTPEGVREALYVVGLFSLITRLADAFGFAVPSDAGFEKGARALLRFGYRM